MQVATRTCSTVHDYMGMIVSFLCLSLIVSGYEICDCISLSKVK
jgi:hypothetical protein